jgi:hypothetical protein
MSLISKALVPDSIFARDKAIEACMRARNQNPKPFIWSATVEDIIKKIDRARVKMDQIKPGSTQPRGKKKGVDL